MLHVATLAGHLDGGSLARVGGLRKPSPRSPRSLLAWWHPRGDVSVQHWLLEGTMTFLCGTGCFKHINSVDFIMEEKSNNSDHVDCLVAWDKVILPRHNGSLGVRDLTAHNFYFIPKGQGTRVNKEKNY